MATDLDEVKYQVAVANRVLAELGLATGAMASLGHASMRVPSEPDKFVVKGRGYDVDALAVMKPEDMVVCDLEGYKVGGPPGITQCFEVKMHSTIYKTHPEVQSVVHCHPRYTVLMTVFGARMVPMCQEAIQLVRRPLAMYPHVTTIQTEEEGQAVAELLADAKAVLLYGHGAATVGRGLEESVTNMLGLEEQAKMNWYAYAAFGPEHPYISDELADERITQLASSATSRLPHFQDSLAERGQRPRTGGGVWKYYSGLVSGDLERQ